MTEPINPLVIDLSHWDPAYDYDAVAADGIVAVIYKATEGASYRDDTYVQQQHAAKAAGLRWGAYHFADSSNVDSQVHNFLTFACPDPDELFCLDWEDNPGGGKMSESQARDWITQVETQLGRPGECIIYGGNTLKEALSANDFFGSRRLWLCQYGSSPSLPDCWDQYWMWQYTDGEYGASPHSVDGVGHCDINSYDGTAEELLAEWTPAGAPAGPDPQPDPMETEAINIVATSGVVVTVNGQKIDSSKRATSKRLQENAGEVEHWLRVRQSRRNTEAAP